MNFMTGFLKRHSRIVVAAAVLVLITVTATATKNTWLPHAQKLVESTGDGSPAGPSLAGTGSQQQHAQHAHDDSTVLELSDLAWKNLGLKTGVVELRTYVKTMSIPAMVVERPGRSQVEITAPMTGIVTRVYPVEGEAIQPGQPLFDLRLTHEDLVTSQRDFLRSAEELDVVQREIVRLESVGEGVIAGRRVLEQQYEEQKLKAALHAQRQGLLLHGLDEQQIDKILETRRLLQTLNVAAPSFDEDGDHAELDHLYHAQKIRVKRGQYVAAGESLGLLGDHCLLYVEGHAFEDDAQRLIAAARDGWPLSVSPITQGAARVAGQQLKILYVADQVDTESRALRFYLTLPNHLVRDERENKHRFVAWKHRPGQRMEIKIPLGEPWENQIVLPPEAVVEEGAEAFVFEQDGDHFDRLSVHVVYRDKDAVVIESGGSLIGSTLAMSGAYQMHLAIKNKASGDVVSHGHVH